MVELLHSQRKNLLGARNGEGEALLINVSEATHILMLCTAYRFGTFSIALLTVHLVNQVKTASNCQSGNGLLSVLSGDAMRLQLHKAGTRKNCQKEVPSIMLEHD